MVIMKIIKDISANRLPIKVLAFVMLASSTAYAVPSRPAGMPDGGCWADPMNNLMIALSASSFSTNQEGETATISYTTQPEEYPGWCYSESGATSATYFASDIGINTPGKFPGYNKLTDDVDFRITIDFSGVEISSPFVDKGITALIGPTGDGVTMLQRATKGNRGKIDFKLRRTLIGGAFFVPGGMELANLYRYVYYGSRSTIPVYRLITQQTIIPVPVECSINEGKTIDIDFGLIESSMLTTSALSSRYQDDRQLQYKCNTTLTQNIQVNLVADSAPFGNAIKTSNPDIGIVMLYNNQPVTPNNGFQTMLVNGMGSDNVSFAVVGSGKKPAPGDFNGSAVLIIGQL
ncbi:fimbrial protein [Pantoea coffeiphila]|uniref:fimbrial protein n=1 Tax=Pantoea coffeiphila TaxID=1465635 RepID=UPI0019618DC5|nr:fimbrial protein [Pantoea coffeiphila]MBM7345418.1 type 1 fimbria pilin [Pantoea coffeiphila]